MDLATAIALSICKATAIFSLLDIHTRISLDTLIKTPPRDKVWCLPHLLTSESRLQRFKVPLRQCPPRHLVVSSGFSPCQPSFLLLRPAYCKLRVFTMLLLCMLLCLTWGTSSATPVAEVAWHSAPNERGTWDLIVSCVLTLMICVYSALHFNVPIQQSKLRDRNIRRLRWVLLGILAPEVVISSAFAQYLTARWLMNEIRGDIEYRKKLVSANFLRCTSQQDADCYQP